MRHFFSVIQTPSGTAVSGASIDVYNAGGTVHATIYSDDGITSTANPLTSASDGTFGFYVADGRYDLKVSGTGITTRTFADVEIFDATEKNAADGTLTAIAANFTTLTVTGVSTVATSTVTGNATVGGTLQVTGATTLNSGTLNGTFGGNPTISGNVQVGGTLGATGLSTLSALTATGNVTEILGQNQYKTYSFNSILWVDGIKYTTVMTAYADLPSTGGTVMVPPNYTETVGSSWTLNKAYSSIIFTGPATLNFGANTITVPVGVHGVSIESWVPWGSFVIVAGTGVEFNYTGTGTFITIGTSANDTYGFRIKDICIFINNAGSAAVGAKLVRCPIYELKSLKIIGPGGAITQQAIILDGTGNYTGGVIYAPMISGCFKGIQFTGSGVNAANANQVIGGFITSPASGTSLGLDFQAGSAGNSVYGTDVEQHAVGYNFGGTSQGNVVFGRSETNTSGCTLGASTSQNEIHLINTTDPFTDSGTNNLIYTLGGTTHGATLTQANSSNNTTLLNFQDAVGPLTGNSADQTVYTYTLPGGTMAKGKGIRVKVWWVHGTGTASITYKLSFGASAIVNSASAVTGNGYAEAVIMNTTGSTSSQRASSQFIPTGTAPTIIAGVAPSETTASNVVVKFTFNVANTDQLTGAEWVVELIQ